jgi:Fic family protein
MDEIEVGHRWTPIANLAEADHAAASEELPALARMWQNIRSELDPAQVQDFNERLKREWAIETGIIERLYTLDQGTTQLLIEQGIDASLIANNATDQPPELVAGMIQDHADAVDWLFDAATSQRPLSTSFVKQLHQFMTRKQRFASGFDQFGDRIDIELRHGAFKIHPNNPRRPDGRVHEYCPPEQVDSEMDRLLEMHLNHTKECVSPDVSAAWLHHRFAQIHPFQDGNGRVARALASLVLVGAGWFPLVVTRDDRVGYLQTLGEADNGNLAPLTALVDELQKKRLLSALSIAEDVQKATRRRKQVLATIRDKFSPDIQPSADELGRARQTAAWLWDYCRRNMDQAASELRESLGTSDARRVWCDTGEDSDSVRRTWNRHQIIQTARQLGYFANTRPYHEWVRMGIVTENGRAEILASFHAIGTIYRGLVAVSMCFYRRQRDDDGESQIIELQPVTDSVFQINYEEAAESVKERFRSWLEDSLVMGLDQWNRGE